MTRSFRPNLRSSMRVLGSLVVCCALGLAAACSDSGDATTAGEAAAVESPPPIDEGVPAVVDESGAGEVEEAPAPEEGAPSADENAPAEPPPNG